MILRRTRGGEILEEVQRELKQGETPLISLGFGDFFNTTKNGARGYDSLTRFLVDLEI